MTPLRTALGLFALLVSSAPAGADTLLVEQTGTAFSPRELVVNVGDTVRWVWTSGTHDVTEGTDGTYDGDEAFHGPLTGGNPVFEVTFDQAFLNAWPRPGQRYEYFCVPHFGVGMTGTVIVSDGAGRIYCSCDGNLGGGWPTCFNFAFWGEGCRNSTFQGAKLRDHGSASASADDFALDAERLLPGQPALLFAGINATNAGGGTAFGDGLRCAGGGVKRLGVRVPDATGLATWGPGLAAAGGFSAGDTRYFQVWYRDPVNGPCASTFNLTNGVELVYVP